MAGKYWWEEEDQKKQQSSGQATSQDTKSQGYWWESGAMSAAVSNNITNRVNAWLKNHNNYISNYQSRYSGRKYSYEDSYVSDSADWMNTVSDQKKKLDDEAYSIMSYMRENQDYIDKDWMKSVWQTLNGASGTQAKIVEAATKDNEWWNSFGTDELVGKYGSAEEAYKYYQRDDGYRKKYTGKTYDELSKLVGELDDGEEKDWLSSYATSVDYDEKSKLDFDKAQQEIEELENLFNEAYTIGIWYDEYERGLEPYDAHKIDVYNRLMNEYGGDANALKGAIAKKKARINQAKYIQKGNKLAAVGDTESRFYDPEFSQHSSYVDADKTHLIPDYKDVAYDYINGNKNVGSIATGQAWGRITDSEMDRLQATAYMTDDEKAIYNYYYNKQGYDAAEEYLSTIMEGLNSRIAAERFAQLKDKTALELVFGITAGLDQFNSGITNLFNNDDYIPSSYIQQTSAAVRDDLKDDGFKLPKWMGGSSIGQGAYDLITTTSNMLPSIALSTIVGSVNPAAGAAVGNITMGASAAGNAYQEAVNLGYDKGQARAYSTMVGASEVGLQYLLGGIGKLGGTLSGKAATSLASKFNNAYARLAVEYGTKMLSEGTEEYLQEILTPVFKNLAFGTDEEVELITEDAIYSFVLGALSSGFTEVTGISSDNGKSLIGNLRDISSKNEANVKAATMYGDIQQELIDEGLASPTNTESYKLAEAFKRKADKGKSMTGYEIRSLVEANEAQFVVENYEEALPLAEKRLRDLGETKDVEKIAKLVAKRASGQELTASEKSTLVRSQYGAKVAKEMTPSASNQTYKSLESRVGTDGRFGVSDSGQTVIRETGEEIDLGNSEVQSVGDGQVAFKLEDGKVVYAGDIDFANDDQSYMVSAVSDIENITPAAATAIIKDVVDTAKPIGAQLNGIDEAYNYGYHGYSEADLKAGNFTTDLTSEQMMSAYRLGQSARKISSKNKVESIKRMRTAVQAATEKSIADGKKAPKANGMAITYNYGNGKVVSIEEAEIKSEKQEGGVAVAKILQDMGLGTSVEFFSSYVVKDENGNNIRVFLDDNGVEQKAYSGLYRKSDGTIRIDLNAYNGKGLTLNALSHELTHFIQQWSTDKYDALADFLMKTYEKTDMSMNDRVLREQARLERIRGEKVSYSEAYDEVVANAMGKMFDDGHLLEKLQKLASVDKNLVEKILEGIKAFFNKFLAAYEKQSALFHDTADIMEMKDAVEKLQNIFAEALVEASDNYQASLIAAETEAVKNLGENAKVETNANGELLLASNESGNVQMYSEHTYLDGGREKLEMALRQNGHTEEEINKTLSFVDDALDYIKILAAGYAKTMGYTNLSNHLVAEIVTNVKTGKQVMSAIVNNGDYPVNIDLSLICKKRVAYMNLMSRLIRDGVFDKVNYDGAAIAEVNEILRENGFETACLGCFVESRRLQFQTWAETIVSEWNAEVEKRNPNAGDFGFAKGKMEELTDADIDALTRELESAKKNDQGNVNLGQGNSVTRMGRLLDALPSLQKKLTVEDLLTPEGLTALRKHDGSLFSIVKSRYGAASPKIVQDFNPYASEIAMLTFAQVKGITNNAVKGAQAYITEVKNEYGKPKKSKGESKADFDKRKKAHEQRIQDEAMRRYLYDIGGARIQSFSDFMIENIFDYIQIISDLAAKKLPLHGYTKEIVCMRLFGMTGAKWNGSLIAHVERSMGKEYAGLLPAGTKDGIRVTVKGKEYVIGFDDYARNAATGGKSFIQSIGMKDIIALQLDPRYSPYVGNITIGVSDAQILAMLDNPLFRMVIPYHASGMLPMFAKLVGVDMYNDYTDYQNTTVRQYYDLDGNAVSELRNAKGDTVKADTSYAFNAEIQKTKDAKIAADNYLNWCAERHPVYDGSTLVGYATFNPKFSSSPYGTDFTRHENYYKLLEDFNTYDCITEESAVQGNVTMNFPSEENRLTDQQMAAYKNALRETGIFTEKDIEKYAKKANMTFKEIIAAEVDNRAKYAEAQAPKWESTVKAVEAKLQKDYAREQQSSQETDRDYLDAVNRGDMETAQELVDDAAMSAGYDVRMFHETDADNIHIFDISRGTHGGTDYQTPYGIFTKTSSKNIGLGSKQMSLFVKARNTLRVENREDVVNKVPGFAKYYDQITEIDKKYDALANELEDEEFDALMEWMEEHPDADMDEVFPNSYIIENKPADIDSEKYLAAHSKRVALMNEWSAKYNAVAVEAKAFLTNYLRSNGYDSMYFVVDGGSRGRQTDSLIVLDENQVKSADPVTRDDDGNVIPLSQRFNQANDDIRYSSQETDLDSDGNKLSAAQVEFFKDSKARDDGGRLKVVYHGTEKGGFTEFIDTDDIGYFFTDKEDVAWTYSGSYSEFAPSKITTWDEAIKLAESYGRVLKPEWYIYTISAYGAEHAETANYDSLEDLLADYELEEGDKIRKVYTLDDTEYKEDEVSYVVNDILSDNTDGNVNYMAYLNIKNPLVINGNGSNWSAVIDHTGTMVEYSDLTDEQIEAIADEMGMDVDEIQDITDDYGNSLAVFDIDNNWINYPRTTREWVQEAKDMGCDGVIFKDIDDPGKHGRGYGAESTVYVVMDSNQVKSVANTNPTTDPDIRFSSQETDADNAPTFYSQMGKVVKGMKQEKFGASSVISMLTGRGVKAEEIRWSGIHAFLDGKKSVTKQELLDFIKSSMLQIEELLLDNEETGKRAGLPDNYRLEETETEMGDPMLNLYIDGELVDTFELAADDSIQSTGNSNIWAMNEEDLVGQILSHYAGMGYDEAYLGVRKKTNWDSYKLDGGSNYRELLFKMPGASYTNSAMQRHWGENAKGILAHVRMQDFDVDGKKMLFIEEIQSDWHNEGQKQGYVSNDTKQKIAKIESDKITLTLERMDLYRSLLPELTEFYREYGIDTPEKAAENHLDLSLDMDNGFLIRTFNRIYNFPPDLQERLDRYFDIEHQENELAKQQRSMNRGIPDAPFHNNYHEYVLKRLIRMAAEEGYDSIGWTTADIQSKRWSDQYAEGYRIEYDQDIPKFLKKYGKQWGASVGKVNLDSSDVERLQENIAHWQRELAEADTDSERDFIQHQIDYQNNELEFYINRSEVWSMDITPAMKKSVLTEGQAMYSSQETDRDYLDAVKRGDMETAQRMVDEKATAYLNELLLKNDNDEVGFKYHRGQAPTKTFKRYAVFNVSEDGFRAAYAGNKNPTPVGVWLDAQNLQSYVSDVTQFQDGTFASYIPGDTGFSFDKKFSPELKAEMMEKYGLKSGQRFLLERGGKHSSDVPNFSQMNLKQDENGNKVTSPKDGALPHNKLIFEIEYGTSDDGNLTEYVKEHGRIDAMGKNQGLAKIAPNQFYDFKTNPNAVGNWGIGGTFRIVRLVSMDEVVSRTLEFKQEQVEAAEQAYQDGLISKKDRDARIKGANAITVQKWVGGYHPEDFGLSVDVVNELYKRGRKMKLTDAVTYDDSGNVIPLSQRFNPDNKDIRYSTQETDNISNRDLLANAFEGLVQNSEEYKLIQEYKGHIRLLNEYEEKLAKLNAEIRKITFGAGGERDSKKLKELQDEAKKVAANINRHDKKLLSLEASEPLRKVIDRERKKEAKKTKDHVKELLNNKKARAEQTELRHKIRKAVRDLDKILNRGNKKQNVKEDMKGFVSKALELADYLFTDHISDDELLRKGIDADLIKASGKAQLVKETVDILTKLYDEADTLTDEEFTRLDEKRKANEAKMKDLLTAQRNRSLDVPVYNLFNDLVTEYARLKNSSQDSVKAAYNEELENSLRAFISDDDRVKILKNMRVADMTTEELNWLYRAYTMVLTNVRNANKFHVNGMNATIEQVVGQIAGEFGSRKIPEKKLAIAMQKLVNKLGWDYEKLYYALDRIGSEAFTKLIMNIANSENTVMQDIREAAAFRDEMVKTYGFNNWNVNKEIDREFLDNTGKKFKLTLGQLMALYAYSRRAGAWDHIEYGGFVFGEAALTNPRPADSYKLSREQCEAITSLLTKEQKGYVEDMQKFLSETMGAKGNEVSMMLYGIKMFGEENYFPIHVAGQYKAQAQESQAKAAAGFTSMSNAGFTHAQNPNAKAPFVLEGFNEVWVDHVNEMSRYHGTVPALEDLRRVMNRSTYSDSVSESQSIKQLMENSYGKEAVQYFDNLYREANSGAIQDKLQRVPKKLLSLFRKNSVAYSLSVVIQQPSAMARAYAMIDKKYFGFKGFGALTSGVAKAVSSKWNPAYENTYNKMLKYAPGVTMAKEIGGFDTHTGTSIREYLLDTNKSFGQKIRTDKNGKVIGHIKAAYDLVDNNAIANLPSVADKIAWMEIWNACERETVATRKDLVPNSEEFLQAVGDRFTEVIRATQVYDSMFSKSPMLKSKNLAVQYLVSFMNEPNTTANMVEKAVRDAISGDWKSGVRTAAAVTYSIIFNNVLKAIVYAMRDDDEDEAYIEKYIAAVAGGMMDDFNPINYIPIARDVWSKAKGFEVERPDVAIIADAIEAIQAKVKYDGKDTENMTEEQIAELEKKITDANWKLVGSLAAFFGIPVKNVYREVKGVIDHARIASANAGLATPSSVWDKVTEEIIDSIPFMQSDSTKRDKLYDAIITGDKATLDRLKSGYKDHSAYQSAVRKALQENDPRIREAAQAKYDGNTDEYKRIFREIQKEGNFAFDDIMSAVNSAESKIRKDTEPAKATSSYTARDFVESIILGDPKSAQTIRDDIIGAKEANGTARSEAEKEFTSDVASSIRDAFSTGLLDEAGAEKMLMEYADKDEEEAASKVSYWSFCVDHPEYKNVLSESNVSDYHEFAEPANIPLDVFAQYVEGTKGLETEKDEWGDVVETKRAKVLAVIHSLPLTWEQKDALYLVAGYSESKIWDVPW